MDEKIAILEAYANRKPLFAELLVHAQGILIATGVAFGAAFVTLVVSLSRAMH